MGHDNTTAAMPKTLTAAALLACLTVPTLTQAAVLTEWGASARTSTADCPSFCTNFDFGTVIGGGRQETTSSSSIDDSKGIANAQATLSPVDGLNMPELKAVLMDNPAEGTPFGMRGVGEPPIVATAAAIVNAIHDAVGVPLFSIPVGPHHVREAMAGGRNGGASALAGAAS